MKGIYLVFTPDSKRDKFEKEDYDTASGKTSGRTIVI